MSSRSGDSAPSSNRRRDSARAKARQLRVEQKKKDLRNKLILQGSLVVVVVAIVAAVFLVITSTVKPIEPNPRNMMSDGIKIGEELEAVRTGALRPSSEPVPSASNSQSSVLDIRVYTDYLCPVCAEFQKANVEQIKTMVRDGIATIEIHPVANLDRLSKGTKYSTRASNAAACVANFAPDHFFQYNSLLFEHQPEENTKGLDDGTLVALAKEAGVVSTLNDVADCVEERTFQGWAAAATERFTSNPIPNVELQPDEKISPTIYVDGQLYEFTYDIDTGEFDPNEFAKFISKVIGADFVEKSVPSPSPTPSPAP